jgi:hypothetical protein
VDQRLADKARRESSPNKASLEIEKIFPRPFPKMSRRISQEPFALAGRINVANMWTCDNHNEPQQVGMSITFSGARMHA